MKPIEPSLLAIFETEQHEHIGRVRDLLAAAATGGPEGAGPAVEEALRRVHTLKGAARAVGIGTTELLAHRLETLFARARNRTLTIDEGAVDAVQDVLDAAEDVLACVLADRPEPDVAGVLASLERVLGMEPAEARPGESPKPALAPAAEPPADLVRVSAERIDDLVRTSSQLLAAAAVQRRASQGSAEVFERIQEIEKEWTRFRKEAAAILRRRQDSARAAPIMEALNHFEAELRSLARQARTAVLAQQKSTWFLDRLAADVHEGSCSVRMTPADTIFGGFRKMVRDLAADEGKEVEFRAEGLEVQADRLVLQALKDPVMHLLRNSISHGIEPPEERAAAGKPRAGGVRLRFESQDGSLKVRVEDDGRGLDLKKVAKVAVSQGLLTEAAAELQTPEELAHFILKPGFSTAPAVTALSGRGVGLAVVRDGVARLQGEVLVEPGKPAGLTIALAVPLSISTHHLLLVGSGGHTFALPSRGVERLYRVRPSEIEAANGGDVIRVDSRPVPLARLADLLELTGSGAGPPAEPVRIGEPAAIPIAVLRAGERRLGLAVDTLLDEREAVVKELGLGPGEAGLTTGGVPLEDGTVAVVLNAAALFERFQKSRRPAALRAAAETPAQRQARVLVVDDSVTTRSLEKSILEAHGYEVRVAVDGVEALEQLSAAPADLVIADVKMPRMDGFELLDHIKRDPQLSHIPVIIVTSLENREDQERGLSLGADAYIVKRKFDQRELLNTVRQIL